MNRNNVIVLLVPRESAHGGIGNYFQALKNKFTLDIRYFRRGSGGWPNRNGHFVEILRAVKDLFQYSIFIKKVKANLVQTSTSLGKFAVIRDGFFLISAYLMGVKTIVFFRGWDNNFKYNLSTLMFSLFKWCFFKADALIVLSHEFKKQLREWGYRGPIYIETTVVDEQLITGFNIKDRKFSLDKTINLLFLARVETEKGIYDLLKAYSILKQDNDKFRLIIAGDGRELLNLKNLVQEKDIKDVVFPGFVRGAKKKSIYQQSDIYIFPTYHGEGMPNSVLEAMGFGLPIIATDAGGLKEVLKDAKTGYFINKKSEKDIIEKVMKLISDKEQFFEISNNNYEIALNKFVTEVVVNRVEKIYLETIQRG